MSKLKVIIADAQPVFREGMKAYLLTHHIQVVGCVGQSTALEEVVAHDKPDVLLIDLDPTYFNAQSLGQMVAEGKIKRVIHLAGKRYAQQDIPHFVSDCLWKEGDPKEVINVLREESADEHLPREEEPSGVLTARELEITRLVACGKVNKQIAEELCLSPHTVHSHRKRIMKKLNVHSAVELTNLAKQEGWCQGRVDK